MNIDLDIKEYGKCCFEGNKNFHISATLFSIKVIKKYQICVLQQNTPIIHWANYTIYIFQSMALLGTDWEKTKVKVLYNVNRG